jgi:hypothetical protein
MHLECKLLLLAIENRPGEGEEDRVQNQRLQTTDVEATV